MAQVTVVGMRAFTYGGRLIHQGEAVTMPAIDAAIHGRLGHVSLDPMTAATYQTRVMVAAGPPASVSTASVPTRRRRTRSIRTSSAAPQA